MTHSPGMQSQVTMADLRGGSKKIKGSGCGCHTPKAPPKLLLCEAEGGVNIGF